MHCLSEKKPLWSMCGIMVLTMCSAVGVGADPRHTRFLPGDPIVPQKPGEDPLQRKNSPSLDSASHSRTPSLLHFGRRAGDEQTWIPALPLGTLRSYTANAVLWNLPVLVAAISFLSFRPVTWLALKLTEWGSHGTWLPATEEQINHEMNVVTQVVNGPVITSISVLFASLVSTTISTLHARQVTIQKSLTWEVHQLRLLKSLVVSRVAQVCLSDSQQNMAQSLVQKYSDTLFSDKYSTPAERSDPHLYMESVLPDILEWCDSVMAEFYDITPSSRQSLLFGYQLSRHTPISPESLIHEIQDLTHGILQERANRWLALLAIHFPKEHYFTLTFLATSICVSFLVATAQAGVLFRERGGGILSVRILWSVLITTFSALAVLCYDLSTPFFGAYLVTRDDTKVVMS